MEFLAWLETSFVGTLVRESLWGYPIVLSCHAVGMALVMGVITMIDVRVLGFVKAIPVTAFDRLFTVAWIGFAINAVSGVLLFSGDAQRFIVHPTFLIKIALIALGGVAAWLLARALAEDENAAKAKVIAVVSLVLWFGAVIAGRLIAYTG